MSAPPKAEASLLHLSHNRGACIIRASCHVRLVWLESTGLAADEGRVMASGDEDGLFASLPEQSVLERAGVGLPRLRLAERDQIVWRPVSLDGLLADDHRVRLVWRFVAGLDLTALHATIKAVDGRPGHPSADPRILLPLCIAQCHTCSPLRIADIGIIRHATSGTRCCVMPRSRIPGLEHIGHRFPTIPAG